MARHAGARGPSGSAFSKALVSFQTYLAPSSFGDFRKGIHDQLNAHLLRWHPSLQGVLLAYSDVRLVEKNGRILYDQPFVHFSVRFTALLFAPTHGLELEGQVNKLGVDHVGLTVAALINTSLARDMIPASFRYVFQNSDGVECWQDEAAGVDITAGTDVRFRVTGITVTDARLTLSGALTAVRDANSGRWIQCSEVAMPGRGITSSASSVLSGPSSASAPTSASSSVIAGSKKRRRSDGDAVFGDDDDVQENTGGAASKADASSKVGDGDDAAGQLRRKKKKKKRRKDDKHRRETVA